MLFVDRDQRFSCPTLAVAVELAAVNAAGLQDVADSTLHWWRSAVARLTRYVGDVRLDQLTSRAIYDWHRGIAAAASAVTANSYLRAVLSVLSRLVRAGLLADSPARFVSYLPEPARAPKAVTLATYERLRSAATIARDVAIVDALWATGCRLAGLLSMQIDRLEFWRADDELRMAAVVVESLEAGESTLPTFTADTAPAGFIQHDNTLKDAGPAQAAALVEDGRVIDLSNARQMALVFDLKETEHGASMENIQEGREDKAMDKAELEAQS